MKDQDPSIDRRKLLASGAMILGGWALLGRRARANSSKPAGSPRVEPYFTSATAERTLVVIELQGGNDGLSCVVPWADDVYHRARPHTRIASGDVLKLDDYRGLHPELAELRRQFDEGRMAIVEGVGYPGANLAHFTAQDAWHSARDGGRPTGDGWIGRLRESVQPVDGSALFALHARGEKTYAHRCSTRPSMRSSDVDDMNAALQRHRPRIAYPDTRLGSDLRSASALLQSDIGCRVVHVGQPGYDTHDDQRPRHDALMHDLDGALSAFFADLRGTSVGDGVIVLVHSEFGRSFDENESFGTEHGPSGPVLLLGAPVRGGVFGRHPALAEKAGLEHTTDFRRVYASVLERGFGVDSSSILGENHTPIASCLV